MEKYTYTVGIAPFDMTRKGMDRTLYLVHIIEGLDGYMGMAPYEDRGVHILFDTMDNAKSARTCLKAIGVKTCANLFRFRFKGETRIGDAELLLENGLRIR